MPDSLVQFAGSLAAILALFVLAKHLKLGPEARLATRKDAIAAARQAVDGFDPVEIALDDEGRGALARDGLGAVMLIRPHGALFACRILTARATAREDNGALLIDTGERRFGQATLVIENAKAWVQQIEGIGGETHA